MRQSPIGLLGVGLLGSALAERMLAAGYAVAAFDLDARRLEVMPQLRAADSPANVAARCRTIVLALPDSRIVAQVVRDIGNAMLAGTLVIDATTGDPDDVVRLADELRRRQIAYVDAPLVGSSQQVRRGEGVVLIGGEAAAIDEAEPILQSWSDRRFAVGHSGSAARLKLVVNLVLGLNRAVLAEGLAMAERCGIAPAAALAVLKATPAYSAAMDTKGPKMVARDFSPQARLSQHLKDVRLIRELASRVGATTPLSAIHAELLSRAVALGLGDADNSAILEVFRSALS